MSGKRKPNKKGKKRAGRRRRKNTTAASVSASTSHPRFTRRKNSGGSRRRNTSVAQRVRNAAGSAPITSMAIAGAGVIGFDLLANKFLGPQSPGLAAAIKVGGGYLLINSGRRIPLVGKYADMIGFGLVLVGVIDGLRIYVLPRVAPYLPQALLPAPPLVQQVGNGGGVAGLVNYNPRPGFAGLVNVTVPPYAANARY